MAGWHMRSLSFEGRRPVKVLDIVLEYLSSVTEPRSIREIASATGLREREVISATTILAGRLQFVTVEGELFRLALDIRAAVMQDMGRMGE